MLEARSVADYFSAGGDGGGGDEGLAVKPLRGLFGVSFADLFFRAADFSTGLVAGFFLFKFREKKCPEKSSRKIPDRILQKFIQQKFPDTFLQMGQANFCSGSSSHALDCNCRRSLEIPFYRRTAHNAAAEKHRKKTKTLKT